MYEVSFPNSRASTSKSAASSQKHDCRPGGRRAGGEGELSQHTRDAVGASLKALRTGHTARFSGQAQGAVVAVGSARLELERDPRVSVRVVLLYPRLALLWVVNQASVDANHLARPAVRGGGRSRQCDCRSVGPVAHDAVRCELQWGEGACSPVGPDEPGPARHTPRPEGWVLQVRRACCC